VTTKDVKLAAQEGFASVEHMKRYTTQGMAPDQGKSSNIAALAFWPTPPGAAFPKPAPPPSARPSSPSIGAMGRGPRARASRPSASPPRTPPRARGAPMIEAGLWYRPSYFPRRRARRTWRQSCDREVRMVREAVGVVDVSTLGKIDIQGPTRPPSSISSMPTPSPR
jgi:hypothetical protein